MQDPSAEVEAAIVDALYRAVPSYDALAPDTGDKDWAAAPLYVRRHLVDHAAASGADGYELVDRLLRDHKFLTNVSLRNLRASLATLPEPRLQAAADAMAAARLAVADADVSPDEEPGLLLAQLSVAARARGLDQLADSIPTGGAPSAPWSALWTAWRSEPTTWPLVPVTVKAHLMVTVPDPEGSTVVSVCADQKLHVFDVVSAREIVPPVPIDAGGRIEHLVSCLLPGEGPVVATIRDWDWCRVWSATSLEPLGPPFSVGLLVGAAFVEVASEVRLLTVRSCGSFHFWDVAGKTIDGPHRGLTGSAIRSVSALPSTGNRPASVLLGLEDGGVHQVELEPGSPVIELACHGNRAVRGLGGIDIRNDRRLVAGGEDGQFRIWKDADAEPLVVQPDRSAAPSAVRAVLCTSVADVPVTVAVTDNVARMYDLGQGKEIASWDIRAGQITSVAAVTVGERSLAVFTAVRADAPVVWDLNAAGSAYEPFVGHSEAVQSLVLGKIAGRRRLVTGSRDATLRVWDPDGGGQVGTALDAAAEGVGRGIGCPWALALAELDGVHYIVSGEDDGSIRSWNGVNGRLLATVPSLGSAVRAMLTTRVGGKSAIVAGTRSGRLVTMRPGADHVEVDRAAGVGPDAICALTEVKLGPSRTRAIVSAGDNGVMCAWPPEEAADPILTRRHAQCVRALVTLGPGVILTGGQDGRVLRVNLDDEDEPDEELVPEGPEITAMTLAEEDRRLVLVTADTGNSLRFSDLSGAAGPVTTRVSTRGGVIHALDTDAVRGRVTVFAAGDNPVVRRWNLRGRRTVLHRDRVWAITTGETTGRAGAEQVTISGSGDDTLQVRSLRTGAIRREILARQGGIRSVAYARAGGRAVLLSGGVDGSVEIHDLGDRRGRHRLAEQRDWVRAIAVGVTPGGTPIAVSGAGDGSVMRWSLNDDPPQPLVSAVHGQGVRAIAISVLDSTPVVVSVAMDGHVVVSDFETLVPRPPAWRHTRGVRALIALRLAGRPVVVSGGEGGDVLCHRLDDESDVGRIPHGDGQVNGLAFHEVEVGEHRVWLAVATGRTITLSSHDGHAWQKRASVLVDRDVLGLSLHGSPQRAGPEHLAVAGTLGLMVIEFPDWP